MKRIISLSFALLAVYSASVPAEIRHVPADFNTIQEAIDDCNNGDTVLVASGIYKGPGNYNIALDDRSITVRGESAYTCVIDCNNLGCGFSFDGEQDTNSTIDGFTIINGNKKYGGAIYGYGRPNVMPSYSPSTLTISNCIINGNNATSNGSGGGIWVRYGTYIIDHCVIVNNTADEEGGGIYCTSADLMITDSLIIRNSSVSERGGGIYAERGDYGSNITLTNCTLASNTTIQDGGAISCLASKVVLINCNVTANTADGDGGALYCDYSSPTVNNSTITANLAGNNGGGIFGDDDSHVRLLNSIIWANTDLSGTGQAAQIYSLWTNTATTMDILYNCIQDGNPNDSNVPFGDPNHNIDDNPMFVRDPNDGGDGWGDDPATPGIDEGANDDFGDLHLQSSSPCINTGFPNFLGVSDCVDIDGQPRIIGGRIDMGIDEYAPVIAVTKPQGDEVWVQNSTHPVNWTSSGVTGTVDIAYSSNNGTDWLTVENNVGNTGSYIWHLPNAVDSDLCLVSVTPNVPDQNVACLHSGVFTIKPDFVHPQVSSKWKSLGGDFDRTGLSQNYGPELGCVKWQFETTERVTASVTVGAGSRVHIACEDGKLYTLDSTDGSLLWTYDANSPLLSAPSVGPHGSVYVGSLDGKLHAVSIGGTLRWTHNTNGFIYSSPAVSDDGDIYVCSQDGSLYALGNDGSEFWTFDTNSFTAAGGSILASPTIGPDGTVYVDGLYDPNLYAIDPTDGSIKWDCGFDSKGWPFASPVASQASAVYQTLAYDTNLYAIDPAAGTLLWSTDLAGTVWESRGGDPFIWYGPGEMPDPPEGYIPTGKYRYAYGWSEPVLAPDGTIYVALDDAHLRAVDPNSSIKWVTRLGMRGGFTLTVGNDGLIYVAGDDGYLCVLDNTGAELSRFQSDGDWLNYPVIAEDNTLIISDSRDNTAMNNSPNNVVWAIAGDDCQGQPSVLHRPEDLSADRIINFDDFALLAVDWLGCTDEDSDPPCNYVDDRMYLIGDIDRNLYLNLDDLEILTNKWLTQE